MTGAPQDRDLRSTHSITIRMMELVLTNLVNGVPPGTDINVATATASQHSSTPAPNQVQLPGRGPQNWKGIMLRPQYAVCGPGTTGRLRAGGQGLRRSAEVEAVVEQFYELMRKGGSPGQLLSPELTVAIGTDEEEWWDDYGTAITAYITQFAAMGSCGVQSSSPRGYSDGDVGWFEDRALFLLRDGTSVPIRFTGVVHREDGRWRVVQTHVSIGTPNSEFGLDQPV